MVAGDADRPVIDDRDTRRDGVIVGPGADRAGRVRLDVREAHLEQDSRLQSVDRLAYGRVLKADAAAEEACVVEQPVPIDRGDPGDRDAPGEVIARSH